MKIGVVGMGSIGRRHLKNCMALKEELGFKEIRGFDPNPDRRQQAQKEIPGIEACSSLENAVSGADAVFLCAPTSLHVPIFDDLKKLGSYHLFIEKPLSHTLEGCEEMVFAQERAKKVLHVGYMLQHHPVLLKTKELIEKGTLGRVLSVRAEAGYYLPKWHPWEDYRDFYMAWKSGGGGALLDISHEINYLQWLFGDIKEVQGLVDIVSDLEITSDDLAVGILRFKNGIVGQVQLDMLQFDESRFCKVIGTEGVLIADLPTNSIRYNTRTDENWKDVKLEVDFNKIYYAQTKEFVKACRGEKGHVVSGREAMRTMEVVEAIRRSHSYSSTVRLPLYN